MIKIVSLTQPQDRQKAIDMLVAHQLPTTDITDEVKLFGLMYGEQMIGTGGLELFGSEGLVRSISVSPAFQKKGFGQRIVFELEKEAIKTGLSRLHLLTTGASEFFKTLNYYPINRQECPSEIQHSAQFSSLCPASAVIMQKSI